VNNDFIEVDQLILGIADYKNDYADMAAEKPLSKCSTSWEAYATSSKLSL
jgi:hypothetical protein